MREDRTDLRSRTGRQDLDDAEIKIGNDLAQGRSDSGGDREIFVHETADEEIGFYRLFCADAGGGERDDVVIRIGDRDVEDAADVDVAGEEDQFAADAPLRLVKRAVAALFRRSRCSGREKLCDHWSRASSIFATLKSPRLNGLPVKPVSS